jgi:hypothetical protein
VLAALSRSRSAFQRLDADGRSVAQHLSHAFHQLVRVIADADHCVGPRHMCLDQHRVESLLAGSFSEFRKERDIAAKQRLQAGANGPENRAGSGDQAPRTTPRLSTILNPGTSKPVVVMLYGMSAVCERMMEDMGTLPGSGHEKCLSATAFVRPHAT